MKKTILMALAAISIFSSCKKEEVQVDTNSYYISAEMISGAVVYNNLYIAAQDSITGPDSYTPEFMWGSPYNFKLQFQAPSTVKRVPFKLSVYFTAGLTIQPVTYLVTAKKNGVVVWQNNINFGFGANNNYQLYVY